MKVKTCHWVAFEVGTGNPPRIASCILEFNKSVKIKSVDLLHNINIPTISDLYSGIIMTQKIGFVVLVKKYPVT